MPPSSPIRAILAVPVILTLVVAAGFVLRVIGLDEYWINPDEGIYYSIVARTTAEARWAEITNNAHPPLYYLLLTAFSVVSVEFAWLRAFSTIAGTMAIVAFYLLGRELAPGARGRAVGLVAAALVAFAPVTIELSQLLRPYSLQLAMHGFGLWGLARWWNRGGWSGPAVYGSCMTLAILTHYSSVFVLVAVGAVLGVALLRRRLARGQVVELAAAHSPPLLTGLALYLFHIRGNLGDQQQQAYATWLRKLLANDVGEVWNSYLSWVAFVFGAELGAVFLIVLVVGIGLAIWRRQTAVWAAPAVATVMALSLSLLHKYPLGGSRHSMHLAPFLFAPIAWGLVELFRGDRIRTVFAATGLGVLVLARAPVRDIVTGFTPHLLLTDEQIVLRSEFDKLRPHLDGMRDTPGALILDWQSLYGLIPLLAHDREKQTTIDGISRFRWGARDVIVANCWDFAVRADQRDDDNHLLGFIAQADRAMPDLRLADRRSVAMVFTGFAWVALEDLDMADRALAYDAKVIRALRGSYGCFLADVDFVRYARSLERDG